VTAQNAEKGADRRAKLRERLLAAAETAIATGGLQSLKAREIAAAAGCALGAIYNAFDDLDELILTVGSRTLVLLEAALLAKPKPHSDATEELVRLALAYLDFARTHKLRWRALFEHRLPDGRSTPDWYIADQNRLFLLLEEPLTRLLPLTVGQERALLARTLFSAAHGIVSLGLEEKLAPMRADVLDQQLENLMRMFAAGVAMAK
jgi:AcrR family transcriptional regulator